MSPEDRKSESPEGFLYQRLSSGLSVFQTYLLNYLAHFIPLYKFTISFVNMAMIVFNCHFAP